MDSQLNQVPYAYDILATEANIFAENPEPRCPCLLLLDTSGSMGGAPIQELNAGLQHFRDELFADSIALRRVEVALMTFGPPQLAFDFQTADQVQVPRLTASGDTPMGAAIDQGLALLRARKDVYRQNGVEYFRPWVFMITDGGPTDQWHGAARQVKVGEDAREFQFFAVGVKGANFDILRQISVRDPLQLDGLRFRDLFAWLSNSLGAVSRSQAGDQVPLSNPAVPGGWASVG